MPNVWVVIGQHHARKSSTIRALTGVGNVPRPNLQGVPAITVPPLRDVEYVNRGVIQTYVYACALQELGLAPQPFVRMVNASGTTEVIVALRYSHRLGDAVTYLNAFNGQPGWVIAGYAVLGPEPIIPGFPGGILIPQNTSMPSNAIAALLRGRWGIS